LDINRSIGISLVICINVKGMGECILHNFPIGSKEIFKDKIQVRETHTVKNTYNMQKPLF
jgi:hypothetical protein